VNATFGPYQTLHTLHFPSCAGPSALQVSTILSLARHQAPKYHLVACQCYWYADTVFNSLLKLFSGDEELGPDYNVYSHYRKLPAMGPSPESVAAVCNMHQAEWQMILDKLERVKNRHGAREAQVGYSR